MAKVSGLSICQCASGGGNLGRVSPKTFVAEVPVRPFPHVVALLDRLPFDDKAPASRRDSLAYSGAVETTVGVEGDKELNMKFPAPGQTKRVL